MTRTVPFSTIDDGNMLRWKWYGYLVDQLIRREGYVSGNVRMLLRFLGAELCQGMAIVLLAAALMGDGTRDWKRILDTPVLYTKAVKCNEALNSD